MRTPIQFLNQWLQEERAAGTLNPQQAVLCTATKQALPHGRVVAIREINEEGLLFFTQQGTRKVTELTQNSHASLVFWFELLQREVIIEGVTVALTASENQHYWQSYPREAQIRFYSYAPTSSQPIFRKELLEDRRRQITQDYADKSLPMSEFYCGFRLQPHRIVFYAYRTDELSDVFEYSQANGWQAQLLSP
ncbi:pyridoxine/pyridoxamine 5'-phosphate oxidase [Legionella brunensis]|uniref:Pyridoxamine 5'-phosphate oxidase n=1 Tax=Legionella brunensis TaxID=29422 RepID=A0A0W0SU16_9GAMM|nr:pyridoxal 5'-phosphate synthase [Legionella brunensis]KTC86870.1 pyridoxamine 5'-phosphate oxidase [Legionella brunensis]